MLEVKCDQVKDKVCLTTGLVSPWSGDNGKGLRVPGTASAETLTVGSEDKEASGTPDSLRHGPRFIIAQLCTLLSDPPSLPTGKGAGFVIPAS